MSGSNDSDTGTLWLWGLPESSEVLSSFFQLDDGKTQKIWHSRKENPVLKLATMARNKSDKISTDLSLLHPPPKRRGDGA